MPLPRWLGRVNKRVFNPREIRKGERPVLVHAGRRSGKTFRTPLEALEIDGGYLFVMMYGPESDWVKNTLSAGSASLETNGTLVDLTAPHVVPIDMAFQLLGTDRKRPPAWAGVNDCLVMRAS